VFGDPSGARLLELVQLFHNQTKSKGMKTFVRMAALCVAGASLLTACQKEDKAVNLEKEPQTVIELMEKEEGKTFFKKDLVLKDASGQNEVVLRVASQSEEVLNNYLTIHNLTISPVFKLSTETVTGQQPKPDQTTGVESKKKPDALIVTEAISRKLQAGAIGYSLNVEVNNLKLLEVSTSIGIVYIIS